MVKTVFQLSLTAASTIYLYQSNFFIPGYYESSVWSGSVISNIHMIQAVFEIGDLVAELLCLKHENSKAHLPYDSIIHHTVTAGYSFYVSIYYLDLHHEFLGLAIAGVACQLIGPLYTSHRLKYRFKQLPLLTLIVQLGWRTPLAIVAVLRAFQFFHLTPWIHSILCLVLARLDYRWSLWALKNYNRSKNKTV